MAVYVELFMLSYKLPLNKRGIYMNAEAVLLKIIQVFTENLDELLSIETRNEFIHGEMTAYVEGLEILQGWNKSAYYGLDYVIESKYHI